MVTKRMVGCVVVLLSGTAATVNAAVIKEDYKVMTVAGNTSLGIYRDHQDYTSNGKDMTCYLEPKKATEINNTSGVFFFDKLSDWATGSGWTFASSGNTLSTDSLIVHSYAAIGSAGTVGCDFQVEYKPSTAVGSTDPINNVHWIQVIKTNKKANNPVGTFDWKVDNGTSTSPYYDDKGAATSRQFYDQPTRGSDTDKSIWWSAELFLCTGPAVGSPGQVTLYRTGISYGFVTAPVPGSLPALALAGLIATRRRR